MTNKLFETFARITHKRHDIRFRRKFIKYIPKALNIIQKRLNKRNNTTHRVVAASDEFGKGVKDPELFKKLGSDMVLITFDISQQRKWQERVAIEQEGVNVIYFRLNNNLNYWQMVRLFFNAWEDILSCCNQKSRPFLQRYKPRDVRRLARM